MVVLALICAVALPYPASRAEKSARRVPTSCDSTVQVQFERGVAMLHSYWSRKRARSSTRSSSRSELRDPPTGGLGRQLPRELAGRGAVAERHRAARKGSTRPRAIGARPARGGLDRGIGVYYRDPDKVPLNARLIAYTKAMEQRRSAIPTTSRRGLLRADPAGLRPKTTRPTGTS